MDATPPRRDDREPQPLVLGDLACVQCGYNLKGLRRGGACPECGRPIPPLRTGRVRSSVMTDAPPTYLRRLSVELLGMAVLFPLMIVSLALLGSTRAVLAAVPACPIAGAWWVLVWRVTAMRPATKGDIEPPARQRARLRAVSRGMQGCWLAGAGAIGAAVLAYAFWSVAQPPRPMGLVGPPPALVQGLAWAGVALLGIALIGLIPLSIVLADLADWANETGSAARLRGTAWLLCLCGPLAVGPYVLGRVPGTVAGALSWLGIPATVGVLVALAIFEWSLFSLSRTAAWAVTNSLQATARDERLARRAARALAAQRARNVAGR